MKITRDDRLRMERVHVHAWPALATETIDGWLWRCSGGGSNRANSVSTIDFHGADPDAAISRAETLYRTRNAETKFQLFNETSPPNLADILQARGYRPVNPTTTMFKRPTPTPPPQDVELHDHPWPEWRNLYLTEIAPDRRSVNNLILDRIPSPGAFVACRRNGAVVATGLAVIGFGCAAIECVATSADTRRQGAATSVLSALQSWAARQDIDWIGLQVVTGNTPGVALYQRLGFVAGATNTYWIR
ncbi:MAG TPA: GNAT family N-acetyltransferase [Rhodopila sp.]|nr:GNAT family N-acetyltransferase [Rhodopila sp.]